MVDRIAYYDVIINALVVNNLDKELLTQIIPEDIVQYIKLDLKTMKDIKNHEFSLHVEREAMASSCTLDICSNIYGNMYTISIIDNESKIMKVFNRTLDKYYELDTPNKSSYCRGMIKKVSSGMYVVFHNMSEATIRYYNEESTEIIGKYDTDFRILSNTQFFGLLPDGEVAIKRNFACAAELVEFLENIEEEYSKEIGKLQLNK